MDEKPKKTDESRNVYRGGLALSIPSLLLSGPLAGFLLAYLAIRVFDLEGETAKWTQVSLVLLGFAAGARETIKVLRRISEE